MLTDSKLATKYFLLALIAVILAGVGGITRLAAQGTTATMLGTVTDASGAVVVNATVQVKNVGTGQIRTTQTDAAGRYNVPDLFVGNYEVQAMREGFATVVHKGIALTCG